MLTGGADGLAMVWRVARRAWPRRAALPRRPLRVLRGHGAPLACGTLSRALGVALTVAADGRALLHALEARSKSKSIGVTWCIRIASLHN